MLSPLGPFPRSGMIQRLKPVSNGSMQCSDMGSLVLTVPRSEPGRWLRDKNVIVQQPSMDSLPSQWLQQTCSARGGVGQGQAVREADAALSADGLRRRRCPAGQGHAQDVLQVLPGQPAAWAHLLERPAASCQAPTPGQQRMLLVVATPVL